MHARREVRDLRHLHDSLPRQRIAIECREGDRRIQRRLLALLRGDDHFFEAGGFGSRLRLRRKRGRECQTYSEPDGRGGIHGCVSPKANGGSCTLGRGKRKDS